MPKHEAINYLEFSSKDMAATKAFFEKCFGWSFTDYGEDYTAFRDGDLDGGFYPSEKASTTEQGGALVIFYSETLEATQAKVQATGGNIVKPIFSFPGGRRFQFIEPGGNEFAVWSDKES